MIVQDLTTDEQQQTKIKYDITRMIQKPKIQTTKKINGKAMEQDQFKKQN